MPKTCPKCAVFIASLDPHVLCESCGSRDCSQSAPCEECSVLSSSQWQDWEAYKVSRSGSQARKAEAKKASKTKKGKGKGSRGSTSKSSNPTVTPPDGGKGVFSNAMFEAIMARMDSFDRRLEEGGSESHPPRVISPSGSGVSLDVRREAAVQGQGLIIKSPPGFPEGYIPDPDHLVRAQEIVSQANPVMELAKTSPIPGLNGTQEPTGSQGGSVKITPVTRARSAGYASTQEFIIPLVRGTSSDTVRAQGLAGALASANMAPAPIGRLSLCETVSQGGRLEPPVFQAVDTGSMSPQTHGGGLNNPPGSPASYYDVGEDSEMPLVTPGPSTEVVGNGPSVRLWPGSPEPQAIVGASNPGGLRASQGGFRELQTPWHDSAQTMTESAFTQGKPYIGHVVGTSDVVYGPLAGPSIDQYAGGQPKGLHYMPYVAQGMARAGNSPAVIPIHSTSVPSHTQAAAVYSAATLPAATVTSCFTARQAQGRAAQQYDAAYDYSGPGIDDAALESAKRCMRAAGYTFSDTPVLQEDQDTPTVDFDAALQLSVVDTLDKLVPLADLRDDIRRRHPVIPPIQGVPQRSHQSAGMRQLAPPGVDLNPNLPLSSVITGWLDRHMRVLDGTGSLGKASRTTYAKGTYPKLPTISSKRYLPPDSAALFQTPALPDEWHSVCASQASQSPGGYHFSQKEMEEKMVNAGYKISVISDLDWSASGATHLLNQMVANPQITSKDHITYLQRYLLEICRGVEILGLLQTAQYANLVWHMRDAYLTKLHPAVPRASRDALRRSSLRNEGLFQEETVLLASSSMQENIQAQMNASAFQRLQAPSNRGRSYKRGPPAPYVRRDYKRSRPTQTRAHSAHQQQQQQQQQGSGRGWNPSARGNQSRGRSGRGRGRGRSR